MLVCYQLNYLAIHCELIAFVYSSICLLYIAKEFFTLQKFCLLSYKMDCNLNLQTELQQQCRICLQNGDINIWDCKVTLKPEVVIDAKSIGDSMDITFFDIINIFSKSKVMQRLHISFLMFI